MIQQKSFRYSLQTLKCQSPCLKARRFKLCNSLMSVINTVLTCLHKHYVMPNNQTARATTQQSRWGKKTRFTADTRSIAYQHFVCVVIELYVCLLVEVMRKHTNSKKVPLLFVIIRRGRGPDVHWLP